MASNKTPVTMTFNPFAAALRPLVVERARSASHAAARRVEKVAADLGADLADPVQYRVCVELAA